ncbi:MAG: hypothetical protein MK132_03470 [Lentisphaerales bacterium]|nr:hypothetical protein [Lentisphaerales bacterium]
MADKEFTPLWEKEFLKNAFQRVINEELYRWIVDTSSSLYPELVDDFLYVLFLDRNPDIRLFANLRAKGLLDPKPLAQKLSVIADSQLTIELFDFLLFCETPDALSKLKEKYKISDLKEPSQFFAYVSCLLNLPRSQRYNELNELYKSVKSDPIRQAPVLSNLIRVAPVNRLQELLSDFIACDSPFATRGNLCLLLCPEFLLDKLIFFDSKEFNKEYVEQLYSALNSTLNAVDLSAELINALCSTPDNAPAIFIYELNKVAEKNSWDIPSWLELSNSNNEVEEYQEFILLAFEILKYYSTVPPTHEVIVNSYLTFNAAASVTHTKFDSSDLNENIQSALDVIKLNRLSVTEPAVKFLAESEPKLSCDDLFKIIENDKSFISIGLSAEILKRWAISQPDACQFSLEKVISFIHEKQGGFVCEDLCIFLDHLGPRAIPFIAKALENTQDKQKQNYLSTCLQSIPYMEAFDALRGHIKQDNQHLIDNLYHPEIFSIIDKFPLSGMKAKVIVNTCELFELQHPEYLDAKTKILSYEDKYFQELPDDGFSMPDLPFDLDGDIPPGELDSFLNQFTQPLDDDQNIDKKKLKNKKKKNAQKKAKNKKKKK